MKFPSRLVPLLALPICFVSCGPDYVKRYDEPLSYAEASKKKEIDFPLPSSGCNIYYGIYSDWQAHTLLVRFEAPVEDCIHHIDTVLAWHDAIHGRSSTHPRISVSSVEHPGAGLLTPALWFTPETITRGIYAGENFSHKPQIWIDLDRGIFYFRVSD